jgi:hypothetical protein
MSYLTENKEVQNVYVILAYTSGTKYVIYRTLLYILIIKATVLHVHLKISQFVNKMCSQQACLVASLSTSCNNAVILSGCYKVVSNNLLTNC